MLHSLDNAVARLGTAIRTFPWENGVAYADWLAQTYYYVRHSTRLLAVAGGRFPFDPRGDALHTRFGHHMAEEHKHELLALHDLKNMKLGMLDQYPELASTRMFYESQYYKVEHQDPLALFGYILPLEMMSAQHGPVAYEATRAAWGARCISFLKVHVQEDDDHVEKAMKALEGLTPAQERVIAESVEETTFGYCAMLQQIRERSAAIGIVTTQNCESAASSAQQQQPS